MVNDVPSDATELCFSTATDIARWIRTGDISARDVMAAHLEQIERVNPAVNAIVTLLDGDTLMASALSSREAATPPPTVPKPIRPMLIVELPRFMFAVGAGV